MIDIKTVKIVENSNTVLGLRKPYTTVNVASRTVLTDDIFSYVDFYFKKNKRKLVGSDGKEIKQNYLFYWHQAENFYRASKLLPIESAPLPMYYAMLNAAKAYILYVSKDVKGAIEALGSHGLHECKDNSDSPTSLGDIFIERYDKGVFYYFSHLLDTDFENKWPNRTKNVKYSIKELMGVLPFIHSAYVATYSVKRKDEMFLPLPANVIPTYFYCSDRKIHLIIDLQKTYFKRNATSIPKEIMCAIPDEFDINKNNLFELVSKEGYKKSDISKKYFDYRKLFSYISADRRLWYLNKKCEKSYSSANKMSISMAIMHRFSEIVRYKPEQMDTLLNGKENWIIREFVSLALDQFIDEIACEITKQEIMQSRIK